MMKEIRFWTTLILLVLTVGYITYRQYRTQDASFPEIKIQKIPEMPQDIPSETVRNSVLPTEMRFTAVSAGAEEMQPESPGAECSDEKTVQDTAMPGLPVKTITEMPDIPKDTPSETFSNSVLSKEMRSAAVTAGMDEALPESPGADIPDEKPVHDATMPWIPAEKIAEIREKLDALSDLSEDLIGWLYIADTDIDYPVVKGEDNRFYLNHAPDKKPNQMGTIFLDRQCSRDLSGKRNILYGHNFQYGMFGTLRSFKERQNYDLHPYGWFLTAESVYRIEFFSLVIVRADDAVYLTPDDETAWQNAIAEHSLYCTDDIPEPEAQWIALSTCASDFEDARELLIGRMRSLTDTEAQEERQEADGG